MSRRKVAPWLLAASVFLTGATGLLTGMTSTAHAITSVEELRDVNSSSWAYQALADLVEKYDVIEGYPDYTFKGNHAATRYELAAALNATIKAVGRDLARLGAEKANKADLATLAKLQEEFRNELAALNARTSALESRASAIEAKNAEQDTRLDLLERTQLHGDVSFGALYETTSKGVSAAGGRAAGPEDSIGTLGRVRLGLKVPVVQNHDNSKVGEGDMIIRLVGAFGHWAPSTYNAGGGFDSAPISGYSAIAGNSSVYNEGVHSSSLNTGTTTGANLRQNVYIESAYLKQAFKSGIPILTDLVPGVNILPNNDKFRTTADLYVGIVPWRNLFNRSPYRGDELNQFQNTSLVNNAGLLANNILPTLALAWHQGLGSHLSADATGAVASLDTSNALNGMEVSEEVALNYDTSFLGSSFTKPGSVYAGGYHIMFNTDRTLSNVTGGTYLASNGVTTLTGNGHSINAVYGGINQEFWRGIGGSVDYVLNQVNNNNAILSALQNGTGNNASLNTLTTIAGVRDSLSAVVTVPLTVFSKNLTSRAKDLIGVGYSWIQPTQTGPTVAGIHNTVDEHVFEAFYRWSINNSMTIIPSGQMILNRFGVGNNGIDYVVGLRTNYVF